MKKGWFILAAVLVMVFGMGLSAWAQDGDAILGKWITAEGKATVEIYKSGNTYSGKMIALKEPKNPDGTDKLDVKNPDEAKRTRPLIGLNIMSGLTFKGDNSYEDGAIYAPDSGKTYKLKATFKGQTLDLRGFVGISLIGRTQVWTRAQ
jgi:uncharacterized protein (DUF2147 family)